MNIAERSDIYQTLLAINTVNYYSTHFIVIAKYLRRQKIDQNLNRCIIYLKADILQTT